MLKYSLILIGIYVLYYAGNIIYDLFLKKEKTVVTDESEEFSLISFAKTESPPESRIEIDDVENIRTPKSFQKANAPISIDPSTVFEKPDLEEMRRKFEAEEELDGNFPPPESKQEISQLETQREESEPQKETEMTTAVEMQNETQNEFQDAAGIVNHSEVEKGEEKESEKETEKEEFKKEIQEEKQAQMSTSPDDVLDEQWNNFVSLANSAIQLMKNYNGEKVYHSTM